VVFGSGRILRIENRRTERQIEARVVWGSSDARGLQARHRVPGELDFWGDDYAPDPRTPTPA
jgi:hypothetical protein